MRKHTTSRFQRRLRLIPVALSAPGCLLSQEPAPATIPAPPPVVLFGKRVSVVVGTPRAIAQASDSVSVARALETCPSAFRGSFNVAYAHEPAGVRGASRDDRLLIVLVPTSNPANACAANASSPALLARGIQFGSPATFDLDNYFRGIEVSARGRPVPLDSSAHRPLVAISGSIAQPIGPPSQITTWISTEYLAPDVAGRFPEVTLRISPADSSPPENVILAGELLRDMWHDLIAARIEKLGDARMVHAPMHLPSPRDKHLREAHALYSAGQVVAAARIAEQRLSVGDLSSEDARAARMLIVGALLAHDDSSAARVVLTDVLADAPCLTLSEGQGPAERLIDALRPPARCSVTPLRRVLLASLVPGMGQAVTGNRPGAFVGAAATGTGAVAAWALARNGDQAYRRYLDARSTDEVANAYSDATRARRAARVVLGCAATAWLVAGTTAVFNEWGHTRAVARTHDYDLLPTVGLLPNEHGSEARISMSVTW